MSPLPNAVLVARATATGPKTEVSSSGERLEKITIASLDDPKLGVEAQYNPKEISIEKTIPWTAHKGLKGNDQEFEFTGGGTRTMTVDLLFDGFELKTSVETVLADVMKMSDVRDRAATKGELLRPHNVAVVWGQTDGGYMPAFRGVIESVSTKYTMFLPDGRPVRATCTLKIKEAKKFKAAPNGKH